jgi:hypothetical protein
VGLEGGPLSLVSATEEHLGRNSSGSGLEIREYDCWDFYYYFYYYYYYYYSLVSG